MRPFHRKLYLLDVEFLFAVSLFTVAICVCSFATAARGAEKLRLIVMTDVGEDDPDDEMSLVRLLMYFNEWDIEGLIATKNMPGHSLHPELIR